MLLGILASMALSAEPPAELKRLVDQTRVEAASRPDNGGIPRELSLKGEAIIAFGADAIPLTVPLLKHPSQGVRSFFGSVVRDLPGLTAAELPALIAAYRSGNGWIAPAIASIPTPEATSFLIKEFTRQPQSTTQLTFAVSRLGARGAMSLAASLRSQTRPHSEFPEAACVVYREIGEASARAGPELLSLLTEKKWPVANRLAALKLLSCSPAPTAAVKSEIDAAVASSLDLVGNPVARDLQIKLGTPEGIASALARLAEHPDEVGRLSAAGQAAREAEPAVLTVLENEAAEIRLEAIETLGDLGGAPSVTRLEALLSDQRDWRAPCAAALALSQLAAAKSAALVRAAAATTWYPPTAVCLRKAATALERGRPLAQDRFRDPPDGAAFRLSPRVSSALGPDELDERARKKLKLAGEIVGWSETGRHVQNISAVPLFALAIDGGVLAGSDRGEWGGELALLRPSGQLNLLEENVHGIHRVGSQIVVVIGLAHLGLDSGALYRVVPGADGGLQAREWRVLPGAPTSSFVLRNGRLFVSCNGGDVVIDAEGTMALATPTNAN